MVNFKTLYSLHYNLPPFIIFYSVLPKTFTCPHTYLKRNILSYPYLISYILTLIFRRVKYGYKSKRHRTVLCDVLCNYFNTTNLFISSVEKNVITLLSISLSSSGNVSFIFPTISYIVLSPSMFFHTTEPYLSSLI